MDKNMTNIPTTAELHVSKTKEQIIIEAQRMEESTLYSYKGHFVASHFWSKFHLFIGVPMVIMSAVVGASALSQFDTQKVIAGVLSIIITIFSGLMTFLNPNQKSSAHHGAASQYYSLQNNVRIFRTIDCPREESEQVLTEKLKYFSEQKDKLNDTYPQIPPWAYRVAKKGIEAGEAEFLVDKAK
jgi:hypothetical protein